MERSFEKLDVKKNLGLDFYQFESHVKAYVLELVEPTIRKSAEDHDIITALKNGFDNLK